MQHGYGGIDAYGLDEVPIPRAGPGEVVVRVHYAALNPIDFKRREGYVASATGPEPFPVVPGYDVAGVVHELGEGVTALALGDAVYGLAHAGGLAVQKHGTFAQYTKFAAEAFARQPEGLGAAACAALPVSLLTTHQALAAMGVTGPGSGRGKSILVTGGAGGVGHLALQLLRHHFGFAEVAATCSAAKADCCRAFGATAVVDYNDTTYPAAYEKRFDFLYDTAGDAAVSKVVVKDGGQLCSIAAFGVEGVPVHVLRGSPDLARYETLLQNRVVVPKVEVFELENYKAAFARLEGGRVVGKIVLRMPQ